MDRRTKPVTTQERATWKSRVYLVEIFCKDPVNARSFDRLLEDSEEREERARTAKEIDALLESEFGGFYLSAPEGEPLAKIRDLLKGTP